MEHKRSSLSEQLIAAQGYTEKLKVIEAALNELMRNENAAIARLDADIKALTAKVAELSTPGRKPRPRDDEYISSKSMALRGGVSKDQTTIGFLKYHAEMFSKKENLEIKSGGSGEKKNFLYYHHTAVEYALEQLNKTK